MMSNPMGYVYRLYVDIYLSGRNYMGRLQVAFIIICASPYNFPFTTSGKSDKIVKHTWGCVQYACIGQFHRVAIVHQLDISWD